MEQMRTGVWDFVFKAGPQTLTQIAEGMGLDQASVTVIVDHPWFTVQGDVVSIATSDTATQ